MHSKLKTSPRNEFKAKKIGAQLMYHLAERKSALTTFRVRHTMDPDGISDLDVGHVLGSDQDVLLPVRGTGSIDL